MAFTSIGFKSLLAGAALALAFTQGAGAADINGIKFDDTVKVGGKDLVLNGLGIRTKFVFKVYAAGLYLPEKKSSVPEVLKVEGPRRVTLVMMRDLTSEEFGDAFMAGLNANVDKADKAKIVT